MSARKIIECVPNFSEGRNPDIIEKITDAIKKVDGVTLLDVDPGKATNRTVVTFVGDPDAVIEGAFRGIAKAAELIDMSTHSGEHPRMGATDVCPLVPIANVTMEEAVVYAKKLAERVGTKLNIPVFLYEAAAKTPQRQNLANIRSGEYEGFFKKIKDPAWAPDFGPSEFSIQSGGTVIGARDFLVAYNVNLNTTSVRRANSVAFDIREKGRVKRKGHPITGTIVRNKKGEPLRVPGKLKSVKAIGWYIEEYGIAQISMNLTNISITNVHQAFEATRTSANKRGLRVTGSEIVGLVPKKVLVDAGKYFLRQQERSVGIDERDIIHIAVKSLGLDDLGPFDPQKKVIEYVMEDKETLPLLHASLKDFAIETASESPAPGGGSISAYVGALGISLGTMVANLSAQKRGWDDQWAVFSDAAEEGQNIKDALLNLVDEDTNAFNRIIEAVRMPKKTEAEKEERQEAIASATRNAIEVPLKIMQLGCDSFKMIKKMAQIGNPASVSDAGVGALCAYTAVHGAYLNVRINCADFGDEQYVAKTLARADRLLTKADKEKTSVLKIVGKTMS